MVSDPEITPSSMNDDDHQLIKSQLKRILASTHFKSAKQMQRFLDFIVGKIIAGEEKQIKQYTIAVEALSFPDDFDPDSNPAIRIMAGRVRERLNEFYKNEGRSDELIISMPKGAYIPEFHKIEHKKELDREDDGDSRGPLLALVCFSDKTQDITSNRLLFQFTDTLATELSRFLFSKLVVYNPYADKNQSYLVEKEMRESHKADYTLALYLQQLPKNKFKLIYRLLDVDTDEVLWSDSFAVTDELPLDEQDNILAKITTAVTDLQQGALHIHWSRKLLENEESIPEQYQVLAYYRHFNDYFDRRALIKGVESCSQALERNPNDVIANIVLSDYCRREYVYTYHVIESPLELGKKCAETAVRLKLNSHEAHYALAQILFCLNEREHCIDELNLARDISPYHATIEYGCGFHFCLMGKWEDGMALVTRAMSLSSSYPTWFHLTPFLNYYRQEKYAEALAVAKKINAPGILHGPLARCLAYAQLGDLEGAETEFIEVLKRYPDFVENGKKMLTRFLGSESFAEKIWDGFQKILNYSK
jgi:tetratricopeptide (TPR) repeat protein